MVAAEMRRTYPLVEQDRGIVGPRSAIAADGLTCFLAAVNASLSVGRSTVVIIHALKVSE